MKVGRRNANSKNGQYDLYRVDWLMDCIDAEQVLERLNVRGLKRRGDEVWGYCPDHHMFVGREPSHPKWSLNVRNGFTKCLTEPRGSNLLWTASRVKQLSVRETIEWLLQDSLDSPTVQLTRLNRSLRNLVPNEEIVSFDSVRFTKQLRQAELGRRAVSYLAKWNIRSETAYRFGCVEFDAGYYADRLIFPVRDLSNKLVGFVATDMLGKENWLRKHPHVVEPETQLLRPSVPNDYKKALYPKNFLLGSYLLGADTCSKKDVVVLVEGVRDLMKLRQEGFLGVVGLGGTNLTDVHLELLSKLAPRKLVIMLDGDEAGRRATFRLGERCCRFFDDVFGVYSPDGKDPKDMDRAEFLFCMKNRGERFRLNAFV